MQFEVMREIHKYLESLLLPIAQDDNNFLQIYAKYYKFKTHLSFLAKWYSIFY